MDDLLMPAPPGEMSAPPAAGMGGMGGMPPPPPPGMGGDMPGGMPPMPPEMDPQNMALAAAEVTMEMLPTMPDQALSALSSSVMAEMDRRSAGPAAGGPEMPAGGGMGMGLPPMPGAGAPPPPMPGAGAPPPPPPGGIGALIG